MDLSYFAKNIPHANAKKIYEDECNRYFIVKSISDENIYTSLTYDIWATTSKNEHIFKDAFDSGVNVILIFSVNGSSRFTGYAVMTSKPGDGNIKGIFKLPNGQLFNGKTFNIFWIRFIELSFNDCEHLINKLNSNKPLRVSRDGQEVDYNSGYELCKLFEDKFLNSKDVINIDLIKGGNIFPFFMPIDNNTIKTKVKPNILEIAVDYNPSIVIFPVDLSNMSYENYISLYQCSQKYWLDKPNQNK